MGEKTKTMQTVCVLMSTYNGAKYIEEQLISLFAQKCVEVFVLVRDDGSTDNTLNILEKWKKKHPNSMEILKGENVGWCDSFQELLFRARDTEYNFFAFADQDDVWKKDKLVHALDGMNQKKDQPVLYYANQTVADSELTPLYDIYEYKDWVRTKEGKTRVLMYGGALTVGCVMAWNRQFLMLATRGEKEIRMGKRIAHDHWLGMIAVYFAEVIYENYSGILHRQNENSITNSGRRKSLHRKMCMDYPPYAKVFYEIYGNSGMLEEKDYMYLKCIATYKENKLYQWKLITDKQFRYPSVGGTIKLKIAILLGKF